MNGYRRNKGGGCVAGKGGHGRRIVWCRSDEMHVVIGLYWRMAS